MKRFYIRYRKWLLAFLIAGVLAVLYLPVERAFLRYTDKLVREILTNLVETQSKGVYYVNYKSLKFNVFTQKLKLYDFNMYPKDTSNLTLDTNATKNKFYYGISIEEFELELNREWDIFISKELSVHQATFRNPRVKVLNQRVQKMHYEMGEISGELYDAVTSYLSAFRLSDVDFIDARMDYYLNTKEFFRVLRFNEFSIKIRDLDISEERRKNQNRILFADDFELTSKHQSFYLEDSTHSVSFDKFHVSIRKKQLSFNNLRISPNEPDSNPKVNHLTLFAPEIKLSDVDFERFYLKNELIIARLFVDRPVGKYDIFTQKAAKKETPDTSKIKLFNVLTTTKVHQLMLNRGSISVNRFSKIKTDNYTVKGISFRLQDFFLDSNIINENRYFDARRNFRISVDEISHEIPEEGLSVKIGRTEYSSLTKVLDCAGIRIIPNEKIKKKLLEKREKKWYLEEFSVKAIHATRLDLEELERDNSLRIKRLEVLRPYLKMGYDTAHLANQMKMSSKTFNDILSQYIDTGQVGFIKVLGAKVDIVNTRKEENVFCSSTNIDIWVDDLNTLKFKYGRKYLIDLMSHSALSAGNTIWNFPQANERFNFSNFDYSSSRNKLFIANLRSKYKDQQAEVVLEVSEFDTKGLNWDEIINKRQLNLKKAVLVNPKVTVKIPNTQGNVATGFTFESYKIDSLKIANASLKLERDEEVPVLFENLFFNATDFTKTANSNRVGHETISGKLKNGRFLVDKGRHSLDLKNVSYDSQDFLFDEIVMEPLLRNRDPDEKTVVKTKLLNGEFKNFNFDPDNEKMFRFSKGSICEAESFISLITGDNPSHLKEKLDQIHVELLEKLGWNVGKFDTLKVEKGTFRLTTLNYQTGEKNTLQVPQYSLAIHVFQ